MTLLEVRGLDVRYAGDVHALRDVDIDVDTGERLAVIGESGGGKTTLARAICGLLPGADVTGSVRYGGKELVGAPEDELQALRWRRIAYAPQGAPFSPVTGLRHQVTEPMRVHLGLGRAAADARADAVCDELGIDPQLLERHPHQVSGGQLRLVLLAMALGCDPELIVLDEPTAGLDALTMRDVLARLDRAARSRNCALIVVTHDLPAASHLCARTLVLYAGRPAELGETQRIVSEPAHPYTVGLVGAFPVMSTTKDLRAIRGTPADPRALPPGCPFAPRCSQAEAICAGELPPLEEHRGRRISCLLGGVQPLLRAEGVSKSYETSGLLRSRRRTVLHAVSIEVSHGEVVAIVGPSGSGKTTLAHLLAGALEPDGGRVLIAPEQFGRRLPGVNGFHGDDPATMSERQRRLARRRVQLVFQNPADALSPRLRVLDALREPIDLAGGGGDHEDRDRRCREMLARVGIEPGPAMLATFPHELSSGQQQRIAVARALLAEPRLLVADEPTAMLDASEQARMLTLLKELQVERGLALVLVSHDIALVRKVADRILVLDAGRVTEEGSSGQIVADPHTELTRRLLAAAPAFAPAAASLARPTPRKELADAPAAVVD